MKRTALVVIDVQRGFDDLDYWGSTSNIDAEANIRLLIEVWVQEDRGPVIVVRHDSLDPLSPLHFAADTNQVKREVSFIEPALLVIKHVNSALYGTPDLHAWLQAASISDLVVCGIQTNMCVETTVRMASNLGYHVDVPLDATRTFDLVGQVAGVGQVQLRASDLMAASALNLQEGGFARITTTADLLSRRATCRPDLPGETVGDGDGL